MNQLKSRLQDLAGPEPTSPPPVDAILRRGRRARRQRRAVLAATATLAAVAIGGVAVVVADPGPAARKGTTTARDDTTVTAPTPKLDLVAAIAASQNISYKVKINIALRKVPGVPLSDEDERLWNYVGERGHDVDGAFDPTTLTGFKKTDFSEERLVNGVRYVSEKSGGFTKVEGARKTMHWGEDLTVSAGDADPAQMLTILRDMGATTRTGPKTWHFRLDVVASPQFPMGRVIQGDITVGDDERVEQVKYEPTNPQGTPSGVQHVITIDLFDYGTPVTVDVPPTK